MDFILVENKKNKRKNKNISEETTTINILTKDDIANNEKLQELFEYHKPFSVILYGNCLNTKIKSTNDIDIIMMWKKNQPSDELIKKIKVEIEFILGRSVELISMRITNTMQYNIGYENKYKNFENNDKMFIENIYADGLIIYGDKTNDNILYCNNIFRY